jgi:hypothetical protein
METTTKTKADLVEAIRADQQVWRDLVAEVGPDRFDEPGPMGEWTFGDMAGHLLGWRDRSIRRLQAGARGEPEPPEPWPPELDDDDTINDWIRKQQDGRSSAELVAAYDASYDRLAAVIESLTDAQATDPATFPWVGEPIVNVDFTGHLHEEHLPSVRAWLDGKPAA